MEQNDHQTDGPTVPPPCHYRHTARQCRVLPLLLLHRQVQPGGCAERADTHSKRIPSSSSSNSSQKRKLLIIFHRFPSHIACLLPGERATRHGQLQRSRNSDCRGLRFFWLSPFLIHIPDTPALEQIESTLTTLAGKMVMMTGIIAKAESFG